MRQFIQRFRGTKENKVRGQKKSLRPRSLGFQSLESREMMTVSIPPQLGAESVVPGTRFTGMASPSVYLLYWGSYWSGAGQNLPASTLTPDATQIVQGHYLDKVMQYGYQGGAAVAGSTVDATRPPKDFTVADIFNEVKKVYGNSSRVGFGLHQWTPLYIVITGPDAAYGNSDYLGLNYRVSASTSSQSIAAAGTSGTVTSNKTYDLAWVGTTSHYAISPRSLRIFDTDSFTTLFSHELAEHVSDPTNAYWLQKGVYSYGSSPDQIGDFEAENYTYRLNGLKVQAYWSNNDNSFVVPDGNAQTVTLNPVWNYSYPSTGGWTATFSGQYNLAMTTAGSNITVAAAQTSINAVSLTIDQSNFAFDSGKLKSIQLNTFSNATLSIDDRLDSAASNSITVDKSYITETINAGSLPQVQFANSGYNTVNTVNLYSSSSAAASVALINNFLGTTINVVPSAVGAIVNAYLSYGTVRMAGAVHVAGNANTLLNILENASSSSAYNLQAGDVTRSGQSLDISYDPTLAGVTLFGSGDYSYYNVLSNGVVPVAIFPDSGPSQIVAYFENGSSAIQGNLTIYGSSGTLVSVYDSSADGQTYTITSNSVSEAGRGTIYYQGLTQLNVIGGSGDDVFNVSGTAAGTTTNILAIDGYDDVIVADDAGTLNSILGPLNIHGTLAGNTGFAYVEFYDVADSNAQTFDLTASQMTGSTFAPIEFDSINEVVLYTSSLASATVDVEQVVAGTLLNMGVSSLTQVNFGEPVDGGSTLADIQGSILVTGYEGSPQVVIDNSADTADHAIVSDTGDYGTRLSGLAPADLYFANVPAANMTVNPGTGNITGLDAFFAQLG